LAKRFQHGKRDQKSYPHLDKECHGFRVPLSSFGNLLAVLISQSRQIREIARQGVLPWTEFWVSTKPFGTPIGPYLLKWGFTFLMIVASSRGCI
jgi:amino acid transporter